MENHKDKYDNLNKDDWDYEENLSQYNRLTEILIIIENILDIKENGKAYKTKIIEQYSNEDFLAIFKKTDYIPFDYSIKLFNIENNTFKLLEYYRFNSSKKAEIKFEDIKKNINTKSENERN